MKFSKSIYFLIIVFIIINVTSCSKKLSSKRIEGVYNCSVYSTNPDYDSLQNIQVEVFRINNDTVTIDVQGLAGIEISGLVAEQTDCNEITTVCNETNNTPDRIYSYCFKIAETEFTWGKILDNSYTSLTLIKKETYQEYIYSNTKEFRINLNLEIVKPDTNLTSNMLFVKDSVYLTDDTPVGP